MTDPIALADVQARLSARTVQAIFDDDNDGTADTNPIARLIEDAIAKVNGAIIGPGSVYPNGLGASVPAEAKRLYLDAVVVYAAQRHPEYVRRDWVPLMDQLDKELDKLRTGKRGMGITTTPEPAANHGGSVVADAPDANGNAVTGSDVSRTFLDGMGDF